MLPALTAVLAVGDTSTRGNPSKRIWTFPAVEPQPQSWRWGFLFEIFVVSMPAASIRGSR